MWGKKKRKESENTQRAVLYVWRNKYVISTCDDLEKNKVREFFDSAIFSDEKTWNEWILKKDNKINVMHKTKFKKI